MQTVDFTLLDMLNDWLSLKIIWKYLNIVCDGKDHLRCESKVKNTSFSYKTKTPF